MPNQILERLIRRPSPAGDFEPPSDWRIDGDNEDNSWRGSSFDLARGLDVIEHDGLPRPTFVATQPATHPPEA